jgi:hypothetical protein
MKAWTETDLAWDLVMAAGTSLSDAARSVTFAKIGAGESYVAISDMLHAVVAAGSKLPGEFGHPGSSAGWIATPATPTSPDCGICCTARHRRCDMRNSGARLSWTTGWPN